MTNLASLVCTSCKYMTPSLTIIDIRLSPYLRRLASKRSDCRHINIERLYDSSHLEAKRG